MFYNRLGSRLIFNICQYIYNNYNSAYFHGNLYQRAILFGKLKTNLEPKTAAVSFIKLEWSKL